MEQVRSLSLSPTRGWQTPWHGPRSSQARPTRGVRPRLTVVRLQTALCREQAWVATNAYRGIAGSPHRNSGQVIPPRGGNGPPLSGGAVGATSVWVNRRLLLTGAEHLAANCLVGLDIRLRDRAGLRQVLTPATPAHNRGQQGCH